MRLRSPSSGRKCGIHGRDERAHTPAQQAELGRVGEGLQLAYGTRQVVEHIVVEGEVPVFQTGRAPIEEIDIIALLLPCTRQSCCRGADPGSRADSSGQRPVAAARDDGVDGGTTGI